MLFDRRGVFDEKRAQQKQAHGKPKDEEGGQTATAPPTQEEKPLACMIYFFASQMSRHLRQAESSDRNSFQAPYPQHRLDELLDKVKVHAAFSPLVTRFETIPVEIPPVPTKHSRSGEGPPKESMHDTVAIMKFRSKRAWKEWIATPEWVDFMEKTERDGVFRRMPHVRCANSLKGLSDPREVLNA